MSQAENTDSTTLPEIPAGPSVSISNPPIPRAALERAIEALVALLDAFDPDPDLEPNGDEEPTLGWPNPARSIEGGTDQSRLCPETSDGDNEPSLGWSDWESRSGRYELLPEPDLEEQQDAETSLGWQNEGSQRGLRSGLNDDAEPSLASTACIGSIRHPHSSHWDQSLWAEGECDEREDEHDGREPDYDNEVDSWPNPMGPEVGARP